MESGLAAGAFQLAASGGEFKLIELTAQMTRGAFDFHGLYSSPLRTAALITGIIAGWKFPSRLNSRN
jgi:hypothetical protein